MDLFFDGGSFINIYIHTLIWLHPIWLQSLALTKDLPNIQKHVTMTTPTESDSHDETTSLTTTFKPKQQKVKKKKKKEKSEKYELPSTQTEGQIET